MDFLKFSYGLDGKKSIQSFYQLSDKILKREDVDKLLKNNGECFQEGKKVPVCSYFDVFRKGMVYFRRTICFYR